MNVPIRGRPISEPQGARTLRLKEVVGGGVFGDVRRGAAPVAPGANSER